VGLRPAGAVQAISAGAHLFAEGAEPVREAGDGYVTSACYSPTLGRVLALGFLRNGRARHGQRIVAVDALRGQRTLCEVTGPVAFDPGGERMRG